MRTAFHDQFSDPDQASWARYAGWPEWRWSTQRKRCYGPILMLAETVITDHDRIVAMSLRAEESALALLALQAAGGR